MIYAHMTDPPPLITEQRPELPAALDAVIARAMSKNPEERHASATEFIEDAGRVLESRLHGLEAPDPVEPPTETEVRPPAAPTVTGPAEEAETLEEDAVPADEPVADTPTEPTVAAEPPVEESEPPEPVTTGAPQPAPATVAAKGAAPTEIAKAALTAPAVAAPTSAAAAPAAVEVKPEKDEAAPKDRRRLRWAALAAGGLIVLAGLGAAGYAVADSRGEEATTTTLATEAAAEPVSASSAGLGLTHLDTWREAESDPEIPGIPATDGLALEPADSNGESGSWQPGSTPGPAPPSGAACSTRRAPGRRGRSPRRPPGLPLYGPRARGVRRRRAVTLYAAPTSEGVATLACWSTQLARRGCSRVRPDRGLAQSSNPGSRTRSALPGASPAPEPRLPTPRPRPRLRRQPRERRHARTAGQGGGRRRCRVRLGGGQNRRRTGVARGGRAIRSSLPSARPPPPTETWRRRRGRTRRAATTRPATRSAAARLVWSGRSPGSSSSGLRDVVSPRSPWRSSRECAPAGGLTSRARSRSRA